MDLIIETVSVRAGCNTQFLPQEAAVRQQSTAAVSSVPATFRSNTWIFMVKQDLLSKAVIRSVTADTFCCIKIINEKINHCGNNIAHDLTKTKTMSTVLEQCTTKDNRVIQCF